MEQQHAIEFFFIAEATALWGHHWLIEWSTSSFYIKCLHPAMQMAKVSLHGPDPKHPGRQHLRYGLERDSLLIDRATTAGGRLLPSSYPLPYYFTGRQVSDDAAHIVRFSAEWDTFVEGAPGPGYSRGPRQKSTFRALVTAPEKDQVAHVDLYLSFGDPYWPNERSTRAVEAGMGPVTNSSGMHLTAVSAQHSVTWEPDPVGDLRGSAALDQCMRGVGAAVDEASLLWLCEKLIPYAALDESSAEPKQ